MLLGGPNWPNYLIFYLFSVTEWLTFVISLLLFIHFLMNIFGPRRPSFELPIGEKREESRCPNMRCYRGYSPLEDYEICTAALQKHSFYRKNQKFFGIRTVVVYFVSSFFFIPMLTIFFTRVFPLFWPLFAFYNRQNQSFFYGSLLSQQSFPPFLEIFFSLKSNDHVNITTTLMLHICYCALCISTVFEKSLKSLI